MDPGRQDHHYNDYEYLRRLKDLDLMPMEFKFIFTDLVMFHLHFPLAFCGKVSTISYPIPMLQMMTAGG